MVVGGLAATLHLDGHGCPVQRALPSNCTLHHLAPGNPGPPFGFGEGQFPDAWVRLASTPRGELLEGTEWMCSDCPLARLPAGVKPLRASVNAQGIRVDVIAKDNEVLQEAVSVLRAGGATVRVLRSSGRAGMALSSGAFVDLGSLTGRQLEIMQTAVRMGYFDAQRGASILELAERAPSESDMEGPGFPFQARPATVTSHDQRGVLLESWTWIAQACSRRRGPRPVAEQVRQSWPPV